MPTATKAPKTPASRLALQQPIEVPDAPPPNATAREKLAWLCNEFGLKFTGQRAGAADPEMLEIFGEIICLVDETDISEFCPQQDFEALDLLDRLAGSFLVAQADITRWHVWTDQPSWTLAREFIQAAGYFAKPKKVPQPRRLRESVEDLEAQGLSESQICTIYDWKDRRGAPDVAKLRAYKSGEYKLTEQDRYLPQSTNHREVPSLVMLRELLRRLEKKFGPDAA